MKQTAYGVKIGDTTLAGTVAKIADFSNFFGKNRGHDDTRANQVTLNRQGVTQEDIEYGTYGVNQQDTSDGGISSINVQFDQYFQFISGRVAKYRQMAMYPEISDAIDQICNAAIMPDENGDAVKLKIKREVPEHISEEIRRIWDYLIKDVFDFEVNGWELFQRWLVDGQLYLELIMNNEGNNIIGVQQLPPHTMYPIYRDNQIIAYVQSVHEYAINNSMAATVKINENDVIFDRDQILYSNFGITVMNKWDVRGFLEGAIRTYNQLIQLEDATVINKIVRAPVRRLWNIYTGRMKKANAEEYMRNMIQRIKKRVKYDPETGAMDSAENFLALVEDFWFPKAQGEEGTTVQNIDGGTSFDDMGAVEYYLSKLYQVLKLPSSRWRQKRGDQPSQYHSGRANEITQEEINFARMIVRMSNRFSNVIKDAFVTLLRLRGFDDRYVDHKLYAIQFNEFSDFNKYKKLDLLEARGNILAQFEPYIFSENNPNGFFALEEILRNYFLMTDEEFERNYHLLIKEKENMVEGQGSDEEATAGAEEAGAAAGTDNEDEAGFGAAEQETEAPKGNAGGVEPSGEAMGGTEETGGVESTSFRLTTSKPTTVLMEFLRQETETKRKFGLL